MKLFSRLLPKATLAQPASTPEERIASLRSESPGAVASAALEGGDASVRVGAIRLLPDGDVLRSLAGLADSVEKPDAPTPSAVRKAAHERLAQLIDEGAIDFETFCNSHGRRPESLAVAALCSDAARLDQMLAGIDDPAVLARLVTEGTSVRVRQSAAEAILDPGQLYDLLPRVRGKDKAVYKIIRQKCDALLAEQRRAEEAARESAELCELLEQHTGRQHGPLYAASLETLQARWRALALRPESSIEQRGEQAIERCREVIAAHDRELARQAAENEAERVARQEALEARARAREAEQRAAAEQAEAEAHARAEAAAAREAERHARSEQRAAETQAHSEVASLIRLSSDALRRGNSRKAARFRQAVEDAMQAAPPLPAHLERHLQQLDEKLNELRQWKDYVVAPKRIELIEEMEALVGSPEEARGTGRARPRAAAGMAHDQQGHRERHFRGWRAIPAGVPGCVQALPGVVRVTGRDAARESGSPQAGARAPQGLRSAHRDRSRRLFAGDAGTARGAARVAQPFSGRPRRQSSGRDRVPESHGAACDDSWPNGTSVTSPTRRP